MQYENNSLTHLAASRKQSVGSRLFSSSKRPSLDRLRKGLSLVAIVVGGLMFAFGEGGNKRMFAGIVFGIGMAIAAVNFLSWLFPGS